MIGQRDSSNCRRAWFCTLEPGYNPWHHVTLLKQLPEVIPEHRARSSPCAQPDIWGREREREGGKEKGKEGGKEGRKERGREGWRDLRIADHPSLSHCCCNDQGGVALDSGAGTSICDAPSLGSGDGQKPQTFSSSALTRLPGSLSLSCGACVCYGFGVHQRTLWHSPMLTGSWALAVVCTQFTCSDCWSLLFSSSSWTHLAVSQGSNSWLQTCKTGALSTKPPSLVPRPLFWN